MRQTAANSSPVNLSPSAYSRYLPCLSRAHLSCAKVTLRLVVYCQYLPIHQSMLDTRTCHDWNNRRFSAHSDPQQEATYQQLRPRLTESAPDAGRQDKEGRYANGIPAPVEHFVEPVGDPTASANISAMAITGMRKTHTRLAAR